MASQRITPPDVREWNPLLGCLLETKLLVWISVSGPVTTLGAKSNKRCDRLKYPIRFIVQINPIVVTAKSTVLGLGSFRIKVENFCMGPICTGVGRFHSSVGIYVGLSFHCRRPGDPRALALTDALLCRF